MLVPPPPCSRWCEPAQASMVDPLHDLLRRAQSAIAARRSPSAQLPAKDAGRGSSPTPKQTRKLTWIIGSRLDPSYLTAFVSPRRCIDIVHIFPISAPGRRVAACSRATSRILIDNRRWSRRPRPDAYRACRMRRKSRLPDFRLSTLAELVLSIVRTSGLDRACFASPHDCRRISRTNPTNVEACSRNEPFS